MLIKLSRSIGLLMLLMAFCVFCPVANAKTGSVTTQYNPANANKSGYTSTMTFDYRFGSIFGQAAVFLGLNSFQIQQPPTFQHQGRFYEGGQWAAGYRYNYLDLEVTFGPYGNPITRTKRIFPTVGGDEIQFSVLNDFGITEMNPEILNSFRVFSIRVINHYAETDERIIRDIRNAEAEAARAREEEAARAQAEAEAQRRAEQEAQERTKQEQQQTGTLPPQTGTTPPATIPGGVPATTNTQTPMSEAERQASQIVNDLINRSDEQFRQGDLQGARLSLGQARQLDPDNPEINRRLNMVSEAQLRESERLAAERTQIQTQAVENLTAVSQTIASDMFESGGQFGIVVQGPLESDEDLIGFGITWGYIDMMHINISTDLERLFGISLDLFFDDLTFGDLRDVAFMVYPSIGFGMDFGREDENTFDTIGDYTSVQAGAGLLLGGQGFYFKGGVNFNVIEIDRGEFTPKPSPWVTLGIGFGL